VHTYDQAGTFRATVTVIDSNDVMTKSKPPAVITVSCTTTGAITTPQEGDGIPDSSDKCPHNSEHRCFKEGGTNGTTTEQE